MAADHPEEVAKLVGVIDSQARYLSREARSKFAGRLSELRKVAEQLVPVVAARQQLDSDPADASARLIDGKYRCFVRGDWEAGLELLAESDHAALAAIAKEDLAEATTHDAQARIADRWFDLGMADPAVLGGLGRARYWYKQALKEAPALEQAKYERRLEQISLKLPALEGGERAPTPVLPRASDLLAGSSDVRPGK